MADATRTIKCAKGHKWVTTKEGDWFFLKFQDAAGNTLYLRSCPLCFVQWVHKQVPEITSFWEPEKPKETVMDLTAGGEKKSE